MKIQFVKKRNQPSIFRCIRHDGTETWMKITQPFMLEHDLVHYAVETTLNFCKAFYGLLHKGYNITDFEQPKEHRIPALLPVNLPLEARQTEILVSLFQTELHEAEELEEFINIAQCTFQAQSITFPDISDESVKQIRAQIRSLLQHWNQLSAGSIMELHFPRLVAENQRHPLLTRKRV